MWAWYLCPTYVTDILVFFLFYAKPVSHTVKSNVLIGQVLLMINEAGQTIHYQEWSPSGWDFKLGYISRSNQDDGAGNMFQFKSQPETPKYQTIRPFPQGTCEYTEKKNWHSYKSDLLHWSSTEPVLLNDTTPHQQDLRKNPVIKSHCHCSPPINFTDIDLIVWGDLRMNLRFLK